MIAFARTISILVAIIAFPTMASATSWLSRLAVLARPATWRQVWAQTAAPAVLPGTNQVTLVHDKYMAYK